MIMSIIMTNISDPVYWVRANIDIALQNIIIPTSQQIYDVATQKTPTLPRAPKTHVKTDCS